MTRKDRVATKRPPAKRAAAPAGGGPTAGGVAASAAEVAARERAFLEEYRRQDWPRPSVAVDLVICTIVDADSKVILVRRRQPPFEGRWALPGGFVRVGDVYDDQGEDVDAAAQRELAEETGLPRGAVFLEQLYTFGKAGRDPRLRVVSVAYYALVRPDLAPFVHAGGDVSEARWFSLGEIDRTSLAFDHADILDMAILRLRGKIDYSTIAFELVPETFTIGELRAAVDVVKNERSDPGNFRRRFNRMLEDGLIEQAPGKRVTASKPATVYRFVRGRALDGIVPVRRRGSSRRGDGLNNADGGGRGRRGGRGGRRPR